MAGVRVTARRWALSWVRGCGTHELRPTNNPTSGRQEMRTTQAPRRTQRRTLSADCRQAITVIMPGLFSIDRTVEIPDWLTSVARMSH